eukprot:m.129218 g.129218  ORF g.129218 m.129218 type:complete len:369 (-) comp11254_c0_seq5:3793-4899(-)
MPSDTAMAERLLDVAVDANTHAAATFNRDDRVARRTGYKTSQFADLPGANEAVSLKESANLLVRKLALERLVSMAAIETRAEAIDALRERKAHLNSVLDTLQTSLDGPSSHEPDAVGPVSLAEIATEFKHPTVDKCVQQGWQSDASALVDLLRDERDRMEKETTDLEQRLVSLMARRGSTQADTLRLGAKRREVERLKREAYEDAEMNRIALRVRQEQANEQAAAKVRAARMARRQQLEMELEEQLLALDEDEAELESVRHRAEPVTRPSQRRPKAHAAPPPMFHEQSLAAEPTVAHRPGTSRAQGNGRTAGRESVRYDAVSGRRGFEHDANIEAAVTKALHDKHAEATLAALRGVEEDMTHFKDNVD